MINGSDLRRLSANVIDSRVLSRIIEDPAILGLGNVRVIHPVEGFLGSGNTYLMLNNSEQNQCYEVLVKRRCNDIEDLHRIIKLSNEMRMRIPSHEHCAVLAAEEVTDEVFDRASNLTGIIPLVVIKMHAAYRTGNLSLTLSTLISQSH